MSKYETYKRPKKINSKCTICEMLGRPCIHKGWTKYEYCHRHRQQISRGDFPDTMIEASSYSIHL
jgi:hypothetical protein